MALSRTRLIKEKIAVFAPTPSASARMAVMVNAGAWRNMRMECLRSCTNDSMDWAALQTLGHWWIGKCSVHIGSSTYTAERRNCFPKFYSEVKLYKAFARRDLPGACGRGF